jgi:hypothetical protein
VLEAGGGHQDPGVVGLEPDLVGVIGHRGGEIWRD